MPGRELTEGDLKWLEEYRTQVIEAFTPIFSEAADRFSDGERLLKRFNEALDLVRNGSSWFRVRQQSFCDTELVMHFVHCAKRENYDFRDLLLEQSQ